MEKLVENLATFGLGGLMAGAFVYIVRHLIQVHIPQLIETFTRTAQQEREMYAKHFEMLAGRIVGMQERLLTLEREVRELLGKKGLPAP
jgi:ferritin-like protein